MALYTQINQTANGVNQVNKTGITMAEARSMIREKMESLAADGYTITRGSDAFVAIKKNHIAAVSIVDIGPIEDFRRRSSMDPSWSSDDFGLGELGKYL